MTLWRRALLVLLAAAGPLLTALSAAGEEPVRRIVVGLFNSADEGTLRRSRLHRLAEMPLNHLGIVMVPHDVQKGLPGDELMREALGIVTWFSNSAFADSQSYLAWLDAQMERGKKLVILDHTGVDPSQLDGIAARSLFDRVIGRLGLRWEREWVQLTYASRLVDPDPALVGFERSIPPILAPYHRLSLIPGKARSHLAVRRVGRNETDQLIVTSPNGGYAGEDYSGAPPVDEWSWYINPFEFFRIAFDTDRIPKLDTTTLAGRHIYYSHIDGDGWHNVSGAESYRGKQATSAQVHYEQILLKFPDLPVTVGPITGDLDVTWYGDESARKLARRIFELPHVEAGSHTHSHPFAWGFFRNPDPRREEPFLKLYPPRPGRSQRDSVWKPGAAGEGPALPPTDDEINKQYQRPRSYAVRPFDLNLEIAGSIQRLQELLPPGKKVAIMQWSGDTSPFERVMELTAAAGVRNINGGDPRMDGVYRSYAQLSPVGLRVGRYWQIYSSGSNENIYTDNWRARFYAFRNLVETLANGETPIRVKPINVYYHYYIVEREDSLNSLRFVLDYVRAQDIAPITTSHYAAIAEGFYSGRIVALGDERWRIENRGELQTVRFDRASLKSVDFTRSEGVVGQRHHQGSLYVALDPEAAQAVVALKDHARPDRDPDAPVPYLISARWPIKGLDRKEAGFAFHSQGFGKGEFAWKVPAGERFAVEVDDGTRKHRIMAAAGPDGRLEFTLPADGVHGVDVAVRRLADTQ